MEDEDGRHSVAPSRLFLNLPDKKNLGTRTDETLSSASSASSPAVFRCFPLFSAFFRRRCRPPSSPAVLHHPLQEYVSDRGACRSS